jgi:hypothetical protein
MKQEAEAERYSGGLVQALSLHDETDAGDAGTAAISYQIRDAAVSVISV